ncbi:hypothetical protein P167DRAFT_604081 [Morchella conica CCBAS932]|uniref:Uncharacterized protein n=1 Tax=Morchella conica CCBAS932 TaxID=1392247 RepID=A0A3N4KVV1_9PEZI|nr:hypothetical protein P167DRAFT_604081 [Morchella conica CCBAS932]
MSSSGGKDPTKKQDTSEISRFLRKPKALWNRIRSRSPDPKRSSQTTLQNDSPAVAGPSNARITTPAESTETFDDTYAQTPTASSPPSIVLPMKDPGPGPGEQTSGTLRSPLPGTGPTITKDASTPPPVSTAPSKPPNKPSPWEKAIQRLPAQSQKEFDFHNSDGLLKVLDDVLKATETARETCREKMWKVKWKGKYIVLRDIADKTIEWVNKFKTLGNIIAQGDPVHAAIPWVPVRYLIEFIIKDHQKMGEMLVGIEVITNLMGRCAIYEELYLGTGFDTAQRVEEALVVLYADMLTYMINAKHYYAENTIVRIAWGVLDTDGPAEALAALQAKESKVFEESHLAEAKNQNAANMIAEERYKQLQMLLNEFKMPIVRIERNLETLVDGLEDSKREKILDWISKTPYTKYHRTAKKNRKEGTCEWLLEGDRFDQWQSSSASGFLWLRGDPGAGKTTLTSMVVDAIDQKQSASKMDEAVAYFYCKRGEGLLNDPTEIMRSILRQLSFKGPKNSLQKPVVAEYEKSTAGKILDDGLGIEKCVSLIVTLIDSNLHTTIIIDALDECDIESRHELFDGLKEILDNTSSLVKIFISSRNSDDIKLQFESAPNIYIEETDNAMDIKRYINEELGGCIAGRRLLRGKVDGSLKGLIISKLLEKAHGMFLWVELQIKELCALSLEKDVREMLNNFPSSLEETYKDIYERIQRKKGDAPKIAKTALMWVLCSCRPLSPEELTAMISLQSNIPTIEIDVLLDMCHNFLKLDQQLNVVRFFHLSVEEFFEMETFFTVFEANAMVAEVSLSILSDLDKSIQHTKEYPTFYWMVHFQRCSKESPENNIWGLLRVFFGSLQKPSAVYVSWMESFDNLTSTLDYHYGIEIPSIHERQYRGSTRISRALPLPSCAASMFGFGEMIKDCWDDKDIDPKFQNPDGESLLYLASQYGHEAVTYILLERGADVNAQGGEYGNALLAAAYGGHEKIVQMLLDGGADVNAQGGYGNALQAAASEGHEKILQMLLDRGVISNKRKTPQTSDEESSSK